MIVDNFELIKTLLRFADKDDFYFLQIIQRKKDGNDVPSANNGYRTVKSYYITSFEDYERRIPAIKQYCELNNARAYININVRNANEVALQCSKAYIDLVMEGRASQGHHLYDHCCGITPKKGVKKMWIVDVDDKDEEVLESIKNIINQCRSANRIAEGVYDNVIAAIPTVHGFHLITHGFDKTQMRNLLENQTDFDTEFIKGVMDTKKDNPTLLYFNKKEA